MANEERARSAASVESMVASLNKQLEGVDLQVLSEKVAGGDPLAINSFGTAGTAGTLTGCFGTAGTFGSLGATELTAAKKK